MTEQTRGALRSARRKGYYMAQFARTDANRKRRQRKHVRAHPHDAKGVKRFIEKFGGDAKSIGLSCAGRRRQHRAMAGAS